MPTLSWFVNTDPNNPNNPLSYTKVSTPPTCDGITRVCAIFAQVDSNNKPIITTGLSTEISTALSNHEASDNVLLRP